MRNENVFREARAIASHCIFPSRRDILRQRVDECKEVFDRFNISASREDFTELVGRWTRMLQAMDAVGPYIGGPAPGGGRLPVPSNVDQREAQASTG
jgi:hypothetical protein